MRIFLLELKRALKERNFYILIIFLLFLSIAVTLPNYISIQLQHAYGNASFGVSNLNIMDIWNCFLSSNLMTIFIAVFPVLIYSHSLVDDISSKYINNIILKISFKDYFKSKLLVCLLLGGLAYLIVSIGSFLLIKVIYTSGTLDGNSEFIFFGASFQLDFLEYLILVSLILFFIGMVYAAVGFLVSLYTNNKVLIYTIAAFSLRIYEDVLYGISQFIGLVTGTDGQLLYSNFSVMLGLGSYHNQKLIVLNMILFIIVLLFIEKRYNQLEARILEGRD